MSSIYWAFRHIHNLGRRVGPSPSNLTWVYKSLLPCLLSFPTGEPSTGRTGDADASIVLFHLMKNMSGKRKSEKTNFFKSFINGEKNSSLEASCLLGLCLLIVFFGILHGT